MESLPNQPDSPAEPGLPRLVIREKGRGLDAEILLGGTACSECDGERYMEYGACETCSGTGHNQAKSLPVDLTRALEQLTVVISGQGVFAELALQVDIGEVDFAVDKVVVVDGKVPEFDPNEIDRIIVASSFAGSPGKAIVEHIQQKLGMVQ